MLDILRNLRKSDEEKGQEALNAYLDDALAPDQRQQVEKILEQDAGQQAKLDQMRLLRQEMRQLPSRRIPRSFTLDPALYGRPRREPLVLAYPVLRTATVLAAFFFVFALAANLFVSGTPGITSGAEPVAMQTVPEMEAIVEEAVEEEFAEAEAVEEEVGSIVTEAESVELEEVAPVEEAAPAAALPAEEVAIPEMEEALDTADAAAAEMPAELEEAPLFQRSEISPEPMTTVAADGNALQAEATMVAAETVDDKLAEAVPTSPAIATGGAATIAESLLMATAVAGDEDARSLPEARSKEDAALFLSSSLGLILLLLGVVFIVLIVLTLLARRRL
jgi:anti-sigma factor RsiW